MWTFRDCFFKCLSNIGDVLRDSVPFAQFKKREIHPWRSVTFGKVEVEY